MNPAAEILLGSTIVNGLGAPDTIKSCARGVEGGHPLLRLVQQAKHVLSVALYISFDPLLFWVFNISLSSVFPFQVFVRELISNASDALEKRRCAELSGEIAEGPSEIRVITDEVHLSVHSFFLNIVHHSSRAPE